MNKKIIRLTEQFCIMAGLQLFFLHYLRAHVIPSFFLVWILFLAWEGDKEEALFMAFFTGIIYDIMARGLPGFSSIYFILIAYINCFVSPKSLGGRFAGAFISGLVYFAMLLFDPVEGFLWDRQTLLRYSSLFAIYNAFIAIIIEAGMRKIRWREKKIYFPI